MIYNYPPHTKLFCAAQRILRAKARNSYYPSQGKHCENAELPISGSSTKYLLKGTVGQTQQDGERMLEKEARRKSLNLVFASAAFILVALELLSSSEFTAPILFFSVPVNSLWLLAGILVLFISLRGLLRALFSIEQRALYAIVLAGGAMATATVILIQRTALFDFNSISVASLTLIAVAGVVCLAITKRTRPHNDTGSTSLKRKLKATELARPNWSRIVRRSTTAARMLAKPLFGAVLLSGISAFHWGVTDARQSQIEGFAGPMEILLPALTVAFILSLTGALLMLLGRKRIRSKTVFSSIFFGAGALFFIPLLLGLQGASVPSMMLGVSIIYLCLLIPFSVEKMRDYHLSPNDIALHIIAAEGFGVALGSILGFNFGSAIVQDDMLLVGTIVISVYLVMFAPNFFFRFYQAPSASNPDEKDDYLTSCHIASSRFGLSAREGEVLELAGRGYSVNAISNSLFISDNTVKAHLKTIYKKVGVHSKQQLIEAIKSIESEGKIDNLHED